NYEDSILLAVVFKPNESQLASKENQLDLCWGNIVLGEFYIDQISQKQLQSYLNFIQPKEILINQEDNPKYQQLISDKFRQITSFYQPCAAQNINNHQIIKILSKNNNAALQLSINYIQQIYQQCDVNNWQIKDYQSDQYLKINQNTVENLELVNSKSKERNSSLMAIINKAKTAMGKRLLKNSLLKPFSNLNKINQRLETVKFLTEEEALRSK